MQIAVCNRTQTWSLQWGWGWSVSISTPFIEYLHMQTQINSHYICAFFVIIYAEVTDSFHTPPPSSTPTPTWKVPLVYPSKSQHHVHTHIHTHTQKTATTESLLFATVCPQISVTYFIEFMQQFLVLRVKLQSQNKLIHKTNETDGEVDKTDAENL